MYPSFVTADPGTNVCVICVVHMTAGVVCVCVGGWSSVYDYLWSQSEDVVQVSGDGAHHPPETRQVTVNHNNDTTPNDFLP